MNLQIQSSNLRDLLGALGMGHFNATMVIPYMMIAPATTDPKAGQIILIVRHLQRALYALGATDVADSGQLDLATANALLHLVGPNWEIMPWSASAAAVVGAARSGVKLAPSTPSATMAADPVLVAPVGAGLGGPLDFLPDVPGGLLTYAVGGYLLYRYMRRGTRAAGR